ncbi:glycosyltransferase family 4 protein [Chitinophaga deserti]|uniref:glycosyltransferase family 4 protein n=1 Tax=Chitinophaga deserti TaxID=2164099 RepID=UPI000D6B6190|nr:glycosyltransferase family 1 protein [Chitinophaga deserti]
MKVYFDHQIFSLQRYGGISRYFANIYNSLQDNGHTGCKLTVLYSRNQYIQNVKFPLPAFLGERLLRKQRKLEKWNRKYSGYLIGKNDFDVLHPTYYHPYFLTELKKPFVITVHDMIHELFPEYFSPHEQYVPFKRATITKADHIIAISESTKNDLQKVFNIPDHKISVIHHGYQSTAPALMSETDHAYKPPFKDYLLFVGDRSGYKNFNRFVLAVQPLMNRYDIRLICTGGGEFGPAEREILIRAGIEDKVMQISATDAQLNTLYQQAMAFVYPSLYEGFGLPILEAFNNQCPVITSNTSCFKEVAGNAAAYFDPYQPEDMTRVIDAVINSKETSGLLKAEGTRQLTRFPMDLCMQRTLDVYRHLV